MKSIFLYAFLVGVPILGLLGILRLGEGLTPPVSVGGAWSVEVSSQTVVDDSACGNSLIHSDQPVLSISQSGPRLLLTFNNAEKTTLAGEIHDVTITAGVGPESAPTAAKASDDDVGAIHLEASLDRQTEPDRLLGALTLTECHTTAPFTAVRQQYKSDGGH